MLSMLITCLLLSMMVHMLTRIRCFLTSLFEWLQYVAHTTSTVVKHVLRGAKQRVGPYFVDGFDPTNNTAYEFAGCFHHGCVKCYPESEVNSVSKASYRLLHHAFCDKVNALRSQHSVNVVVMWQCEWEALKYTAPAVTVFLRTYSKPEHLNPRDTLFGGCTNSMKLYHKTTCYEKIFYYHFTSFYPTVQSKNIILSGTHTSFTTTLTGWKIISALLNAQYST